MQKYGIIKTDDATIPVTNPNVEYNRGTDLGLLLRSGKSQTIVPDKKTALTLNAFTAGNGYTIGKGRTLIQNATTGNGTGLIVMANVVEDDGILIVGSEIKNTANFDLFQNNLFLAFDSTSPDPYTYARITATGQPFTGVSNAIVGTSTTGTAGTFIVNITNGVVSKVTVGAGGTLYKVGDVVTITVATLEANAAFGGGNVFLSDLNILVGEDNVLGGVEALGAGGINVTNGLSGVTIINGGKAHRVGDVITLSEEGSTFVGTATVTIGTLSPAINTPGEIKIYPAAIRNSSAAAGVINVLSMSGTLVSLGTVQPGQLVPVSFTQVEGTTGLDIGFVQILYR